MGMGLTGLTHKATGTLVTGVVGVAAVEAARKWGLPLLARNTVVTATAWGLRGARAAETGAENLRLYSADILAEARQQVGEQAPAPTGGESGASHDHEH
jgi:hypothetical protein